MTDRPLFWPCALVVILQLCLRGLGMQAWRLQQETLWLSRAGESYPQLIAVFVLQRDWLLIRVVNSPVPSLHSALFFLFYWHGLGGGWWVMTYWVWFSDALCQGGSQRVLLMQDSPACKVNLFCLDTAGLKRRRSALNLLSCHVGDALREHVYMWCTPPRWAESVCPDRRQKQEVSLFCVDACASCWKSIHERRTLGLRLISCWGETTCCTSTLSDWHHTKSHMWGCCGLRVSQVCTRKSSLTTIFREQLSHSSAFFLFQNAYEFQNESSASTAVW